jgi:hypothetical protein
MLQHQVLCSLGTGEGRRRRDDSLIGTSPSGLEAPSTDEHRRSHDGQDTPQDPYEIFLHGQPNLA